MEEYNQSGIRGKERFPLRYGQYTTCRLSSFKALLFATDTAFAIGSFMKLRSTDPTLFSQFEIYAVTILQLV